MFFQILLYLLVSLVDLLNTLVLLRHNLAWEINPIAARLAGESVHLVIYKVCLTLLVVVVALALARYREDLARKVLSAAVVATLCTIAIGLATVL